jgi:hemolysin III
MANQPHPSEEHSERFSLPLFAFTNLSTLAALAGAIRVAFPALWGQQLRASPGMAVVAFFAVSLVNCFVEYIFHRYVLHVPAVSFLRRLYRQHTLHHALTRIARKPMRDGRGVLFIENKYPIVEPEQNEASFFPWYSLAVFAGVYTPLLALLQWLLPALPWFFSGFAALASSLALYEILHAIDHWPFETWEPLIGHRRWGRFWRQVYGFHLRHHAVIDCNESISGFFGLPLADWAFGTCVIPKTIYADGEEWTSAAFRCPQPVWFIRRLDEWAAQTVKERRAEAPADAVAEAALGTRSRGEKIAGWVTHGLGLAVSIATLTLLIVFSSLRGNAWQVVTFTVFGLSLLGLYTASTLQHAWRTARTKQLFLRFGHAAVFLLIAGTYTPFLVASLHGPWGWILFGTILGVCAAGAVFQFLFVGRFPLATALACLVVGWLIVVGLRPIIEVFPSAGLWLLLAGGLCYVVAIAFHVLRSLRYRDACWHAFVLSGGTCHFLAALLFLLPHRI